MKISKAESIGVQLLVAVDFSDSSRRALHKAGELISDSLSRLLLLHVIDQRFVDECLRHRV
jgi:nucleotide-binding universal stress UspA family protein